MKRLLVTGGSGFIGSYVAAQLLLQPGIETFILGQGALTGIRLGQAKSLRQAMEDMPQFDIVVNMAAHIGRSSDETVAANFHGIHDLMDYCNANRVGCLVHISRSFFARGSDTGFQSSRLGSLYEYSKRYGELVLDEQSQIPTRILRITAPIWPTMPRERYLSQILLSVHKRQPIQIYGQGRRRQNYVRLDDIADAIMSVMTEESSTPVQKYWVTGPENFTDYELAKAVCERLHVPFQCKFVAPPDGQILDEADYGIDRVRDEYPFRPRQSRLIDHEYLHKQMNALTSGGET